jgi:hypothetical protein
MPRPFTAGDAAMGAPLGHTGVALGSEPDGNHGDRCCSSAAARHRPVSLAGFPTRGTSSRKIPSNTRENFARSTKIGHDSVERSEELFESVVAPGDVETLEQRTYQDDGDRHIQGRAREPCASGGQAGCAGRCRMRSSGAVPARNTTPWRGGAVKVLGTSPAQKGRDGASALRSLPCVALRRALRMRRKKR